MNIVRVILLGAMAITGTLLIWYTVQAVRFVKQNEHQTVGDVSQELNRLINQVSGLGALCLGLGILVAISWLI